MRERGGHRGKITLESVLPHRPQRKKKGPFPIAPRGPAELPRSLGGEEKKNRLQEKGYCRVSKKGGGPSPLLLKGGEA